MRSINVSAPDVSAAWVGACEAMMDGPAVAYHTVVRIENPLAEDNAVRCGLERILAARQLQPVSTVANTIFPSAIAAISQDHLELSRRYMAMLPTLKRLSSKNDRGTYFGRLAFPALGGPVNQLDVIITRLRKEVAKKGSGTGALTAAYEAVFLDPGSEGTETYLDLPAVAAAQVLAPGSDRRFPGFPCLSHCSFQLDRHGALHALAITAVSGWSNGPTATISAWGCFLAMSPTARA